MCPAKHRRGNQPTGKTHRDKDINWLKVAQVMGTKVTEVTVHNLATHEHTKTDSEFVRVKGSGCSPGVDGDSHRCCVALIAWDHPQMVRYFDLLAESFDDYY